MEQKEMTGESTPLIQEDDGVGNRNPGFLNFDDRGRDSPWGHIPRGIIVPAHHEHSRMMSATTDDQFMEGHEVLMIVREKYPPLFHGPPGCVASSFPIIPTSAGLATE
jgi:hypothetical protein